MPTSANTNDSLRTRFLGDAACAVYLIRPDQHIAARWETYDEHAVAHAIGKAIGQI
jgi:3-(3-hydroxy-phenyl)propionate hydroxylase